MGMAAPVPMLSAPAEDWPAGSDWILQAKWDGFRCLIEIGAGGRARAWSRHGTSLTAGLTGLVAECGQLPAGTVLDGELVAIAERDGRPVQDFSAVRRAVFNGDPDATATLRYVAFDLLTSDGQEIRDRAWRDRDELLRQAIPQSRLLCVIDSRPATPAAHDALLELGFEGSILKRPRSLYRAGRQSSWRKLKARYAASATLRGLRHARDGHVFAVCELDRRRVIASASIAASELIDQPVCVVYLRVDADGTLREARITTTSPELDPVLST
jgi:bifunctional non-homologous end joining protein LigD